MDWAALGAFYSVPPPHAITQEQMKKAMTTTKLLTQIHVRNSVE